MCGIIGVSGIPDAARLTYLGLYALQHRGQESAGHRGHRPRRQRALPPRHGAGERELRRDDPRHAARRRGRRTHPLLHHRQHGPRQRPAVQRRHPLRAARHRPQRQPHQRRRAQARAGGEGRHLHHLLGHRGAGAPDRPLGGRRRSRARSGTRSSRWRAPTASCITVGRTLYAVVDSRGLPAAGHRAGWAAAWSWPRRPARSTCWAPRIACELQPGEFVRIEDGAGHRAAAALAPAGEPLRVRAGVLRPARQHRVRRVGGPRAPRAGPPAGPRAARARRRGGLQRARTAPTPWRSASPRSRGSSWSTA